MKLVHIQIFIRSETDSLLELPKEERLLALESIHGLIQDQLSDLNSIIDRTRKDKIYQF